jgi:hypothetical protein
MRKIDNAFWALIAVSQAAGCGRLSRRSVIAEVLVRYQASAYAIFSEQMVEGQVFFRVFRFSLSLSFHRRSILIHSSVTDAT